MILTVGPIETKSRFPGDKLAYETADMIHPEFGKVGTVHTAGYKPQWAFQISPFRWQFMSNPIVRNASPWELGGIYRALFDGAAWDTMEEAVAQADRQIAEFLELLAKAEHAAAA